MKFPRMLLMGLALLSALWMGAANALPTVDQVQAAARSGDYTGAEKMMREVVEAKPDSARAHYVLAEILAHERQFREAAEHARRARALDPAIKFTDSAKFTAFEQLLQREQTGEARAVAPSSLGSPAAPAPRAAPPVERAESGGGVPVWLLAVGAVAFIALAASWMRRRTAQQVQQMPQPAMAGGYGGGGYGMGGYGPGVQPTSGGPGLMGVGLAAAGGVAAGMLAEKLLHEGHDERSVPRDADVGGGSGLVPGAFGGGDMGAADELTRRDIDFGSGGDSWDAGGGGGDFGGGGSSDDW
ncbi:tetratricopeptide repeat protein [Pelomonas cellulosilytica]|uniref:Tetratricopeptide repeat protein n=1 Tax=Pelomonas cellulosilytica TaxID=2906762 RepID=A0ABS8Y307_9BURK|nr:tetratricopeptide repeat protein [Pelomonas sp. P8]MCE4556335.1 tetratricopeptide repeat protein [Pelomonas sp. P8]